MISGPLLLLFFFFFLFRFVLLSFFVVHSVFFSWIVGTEPKNARPFKLTLTRCSLIWHFDAETISEPQLACCGYIICCCLLVNHRILLSPLVSYRYSFCFRLLQEKVLDTKEPPTDACCTVTTFKDIHSISFLLSQTPSVVVPFPTTSLDSCPFKRIHCDC